MTDQSTPSPSPSGPSPDWREQRRAERRERRQRMGWVGPGIGGVVLILIGIALLAQNLGAQLPENWWAAFLMIPAVGAFVAATRQYREAGQLNGEGIAAFIGGVVLTALAASFYFDFGWGLFWPLLLVAIGAGILLRTYWR